MPASSNPATLVVNTLGNKTLVQGKPTESVYVTSLAVSNLSGTQTRVDFMDGNTIRYSMGLASNGGGFIQIFDPPWGLSTGGNLVVAIADAVDVRVNANYYIS